MPTPVKDFYVDQGTTFIEYLEFETVDGLFFNLETYTFAGQIRRSPRSKKFFEFVLLPDPENITRLGIIIPPAISDQFTHPTYSYDIEMSDAVGNIVRVLQGQIIVNFNTTR